MAIKPKGLVDNSTQAQMRNWSQVERNRKIKFEDNVGEVLKFVTQPAVVKVNLGRTLNTGNYNSVRVDVGVELPCYVEEIPAAQDAALAICAQKMEQILDDLGAEGEEEEKPAKKSRRR